MACTDTCQRPAQTQAHCGTCHTTFGGVTGFDRHRRNGQCLDPATLGFMPRAGIWRAPQTPDQAVRLTRMHAERRNRRGGTSTHPTTLGGR